MHGVDPQKEEMRKKRVSEIKNKIVVLSGKGGVGKSTVSVNLAVTLAMQGWKVGLLDVDLHGPSVPTMLNINGQKIQGDADGMFPVEIAALNGLKVMSTGFLLNETDAPVVWRGPMKNGVIRQFLGEVKWGELDYLIVDCPPGTGDEPLSVIQLLEKPDGAVIVTTPQDVAAIDVSKSINFCRQLSLPVVGIVENMSGFVCPDCGKITDIFKSGGGRKLAERYDIEFLGAVPIDPSIGEACDSGMPYVMQYADSPVSGIFSGICGKLSGCK
jgi:Mrp family chromosome partitioning ATPase